MTLHPVLTPPTHPDNLGHVIDDCLYLTQLTQYLRHFGDVEDLNRPHLLNEAVKEVNRKQSTAKHSAKKMVIRERNSKYSSLKEWLGGN